MWGYVLLAIRSRGCRVWHLVAAVPIRAACASELAPQRADLARLTAQQQTTGCHAQSQAQQQALFNSMVEGVLVLDGRRADPAGQPVAASGCSD